MESILNLEFLHRVELTAMVLKNSLFLLLTNRETKMLKSFQMKYEANTKAWIMKNAFEKYVCELDK